MRSAAESVFSILNFEYLSENETKIENILTPWSVAQAGMNDEKTRGQKSRWIVPLSKRIISVSFVAFFLTNLIMPFFNMNFTFLNL